MAVLSAICGALFLFGAAGGLGSILLRRVFQINRESLWFAPFSLGLGFGALALLVVAMGWIPFGTLNTRLMLIQIFGIYFLISCLIESFKFLREKKTSGFTLPAFKSLCFIITCIPSAICLITAFSPITYYDSLVYHLALPAHYVLEGRIAPAVFNLYSFFPENTEMLYLLIIGRFPEPEYVINLMLWGFSLLVSIALFRWTREKWDANTGWIGLALWWTMPAVLLLSVGGYVEIPLSLFTLLSLIAFDVFQQDKRTRWLLLSGLFSGFACATKYTGAITPIFLSLTLLRYLKPKEFVFFCITVLTPMLPWLGRNAVTIGNPFFPFFYKWFGGNIGWTTQTADAYFQMLTEYGAKSSLFFELLSAPFHMITNAAKFGGGFDVLGDFGWPLLIVLAPLGFYVAWRSDKSRWLVVYCLFHFSFWFITKPVLRFLVGVLPLYSIVGALALKRMLLDHKNIIRLPTAMLCALFLYSNITMYFFISSILKPFSVPLGGIARETYLSTRLSFYDAYTHINNELSIHDRVFLIGEQRTYHLRIPYISASIFAPSPLAKVSNESKEFTVLENEFNKQRVTHILFHQREVERLGGLEKFGFNKQGKLILTRFLNEKCTIIFSKNHVTIYEIAPIKPA